MSEDQKQHMGEVITWILRVLTAVGAFFLIQTYSLMKDNNELIQRHLISYAAESREVSIRINVLEREAQRARDEREKQAHYLKQLDQ